METMVGPRPSFAVDRTPVAVGALAQFAVLLVPMLRLEAGAPVFLGGLVGGAVAGGLTGRYGNAMNNGLLAAATAGAAACLVVALYGSYASWRVGFGLDSRLAAQFGFFAATMLVLAVPFQAAEGAVGAAVAGEVRERVRRRWRRGRGSDADRDRDRDRDWSRDRGRR